MGRFAARERGKDARHQCTRGIGAQFNRHAVASTLAFVGEVDRKNVVKRRIIRMIEIDICSVDPHPPFTAADESGLFHDIAAHDDSPGCLYVSARYSAAMLVAELARWRAKKARTFFQPSSACSGR